MESTIETARPGVAALAAATPVRRDRVVDLLRAVSIGVVVVWHWSLSVTHWRDGSLRMPNPVGDVPGLWAATWLLQIMPLFFLVGGYANLAGWRSVSRGGEAGAAQRFWARRFGRLGRPVAVYVACWAGLDLVVRLGGGPSVLSWGMVVFVPLWFLGVYAAVVALVPWTARLHASRPIGTLVGLVAGAALADATRFGLGLGEAGDLTVGLAGSACVWLFCHQLGYIWHDVAARRLWWQSSVADNKYVPPEEAGGGHDRCRRPARLGVVLAGVGLTALLVLTGVGPYPRSMVAVRGEDVSNMFPTTICVAALAVLQLGVVLVLRAPLARWLERRRVWQSVVGANAVAMTVFCWHMTALVGFLLAYEVAGFNLGAQPTAGWWWTRPLWVFGPALLLAALVATFARFELPRTAGRRP